MELRDYQRRVLEAIELDPSHSQLIAMPTGTGKTITFLAAAKESGKRCLVLVHRNELLQQTADKAVLMGFSPDEVSIINAEDKAQANVLTIAMVPTLSRNLDRYSADDVEMVIVDEAHHATSASYLRILDHFKVFDEAKPLLGFTATPVRGDGKCLSSVFASQSFKMTLSEATTNGYICPVYGMRIELEKGLEDIANIGGDYDASELDKVMNCPEINKLIAEKARLTRRKPGITFCTSVKHAQALSKEMRSLGVKAVSVSHRTPKSTLAKILAWLKCGRVDMVTNAVKLSEGFDFPPIECIILARPTRSPSLYKQMIGRGLRLSPGKYDCLVIEFCSNDESMLSMDDIDTNATYQCTSTQQRKSVDEAKKDFSVLFGSVNVKVLAIRQSEFSYYECKIRRLVRYRKWYYFTPFDQGFCVFKATAMRIPAGYERLYECESKVCFWGRKYEDYHIWSQGILYPHDRGRVWADIPKMAKSYADFQPTPMGRWYPANEQAVTGSQKHWLAKVLKRAPPKGMGARKVEMMIEDAVIKRVIDTIIIPGVEPKDGIFTINY